MQLQSFLTRLFAADNKPPNTGDCSLKGVQLAVPNLMAQYFDAVHLASDEFFASVVS